MTQSAGPHNGSYRQTVIVPKQACLASGWDVVSPEEGDLPDELWERILGSDGGSSMSGTSGRPSCASAYGQKITLRRGDLLHGVDQAVRQFYVLLEVCAAPYP